MEILLNKKVRVQYLVGNDKYEVVGHLVKEDDNFIYLQERNQFIKIASVASIFEEEPENNCPVGNAGETVTAASEQTIDAQISADQSNHQDNKSRETENSGTPAGKRKLKVSVSQELQGEVVKTPEAEKNPASEDAYSLPKTGDQSPKKQHTPTRVSLVTNSPANFTLFQCSASIRKAEARKKKAEEQAQAEEIRRKEEERKAEEERIKAEEAAQKKRPHIPSKVSLVTNSPANFTLFQCSASIRKAEARKKKAEEQAQAEEIRRKEEERKAEEERIKAEEAAQKKRPHIPSKVSLVTNSPANFTMVQCSASIRKAEARKKKAEEQAQADEIRRQEEMKKAEAERQKALEEEEKNRPHVPVKVTLKTNPPQSFTAIRSPENIRRDEERKQREQEELKHRDMQNAQETPEKKKHHEPRVVDLIKTEPATFAVHRNRISELVRAASRALVNPLSEEGVAQKAIDPLDEDFNILTGNIEATLPLQNNVTHRPLNSNNTVVSVAMPLPAEEVAVENPQQNVVAEDPVEMRASRAEAAIKRIFSNSSALIGHHRRNTSYQSVSNFSFKPSNKKSDN
ncbi:MAG: hypothetical protein ACI4VX_01285 [Succinivibrionaceae bacterium]